MPNLLFPPLIRLEPGRPGSRYRMTNETDVAQQAYKGSMDHYGVFVYDVPEVDLRLKLAEEAMTNRLEQMRAAIMNDLEAIITVRVDKILDRYGEIVEGLRSELTAYIDERLPPPT